LTIFSAMPRASLVNSSGVFKTGTRAMGYPGF
jgi:hypothetical protein